MAEAKKIIIDEDWKSQVEAEKQAAKQSKASPAPDAAVGAPYEVGDVPMPPASFEMLLTSLATEALVALGQVPHPVTQQTNAQPHQARYLIDTIDVLRQKTQGNLTPDEQRTIDTLLHQLRMAFIAATRTPSGAAGGVDAGS